MDKHKAEDVTRLLVRFRNISVLFAWLVMPLPFVVWLTNNMGVLTTYYNVHIPTGHFIWVLLAVNFSAYLAVTLWTIQTTRRTYALETIKASVPSVLAHSTGFTRWWLSVRQTWRWHMAMAVPRVGLVVGLAQLFALDINSGCPELNMAKFLFQPYCYFGSAYSIHWNLVAIAFLAIGLFSLLNLAALCALTGYSGFVKQRSIGKIFAVHHRFIWVFALVIVVFELLLVFNYTPTAAQLTYFQGYCTDHQPQTVMHPYETCWGFRRHLTDINATTTLYNYSDRSAFNTNNVSFYYIIGKVETLAWSLVDSGTLATTNLIRFGDYLTLVPVERTLGSDYTRKSRERLIQERAIRYLVVFVSLGIRVLQVLWYLSRVRRTEPNNAILETTNVRTSS